LAELRLHYRTVGNSAGEPVLVLHGTTGSGLSMMGPAFAGELFGPGQPLDAARYFINLPDAIGTDKSGKPSDGLCTAFPKYNYDDMVDAQYRLLKHLKIAHPRFVIGNSMGGANTTLQPGWKKSRRRCSRSIRPTTNTTHPSLASSTGKSNASRMATCC
jgi:homoserine O-acetyltransferase/O-succinyltransferase